MDNRSAFGHLAAILRKAQGRIDAETGKAIDVGYECAKLREQFDALWAEVERLREREAGLLEQHSRDSAELRRVCAERDEARADERTAMGYLAGVRQVVGGEDFPDMVLRVGRLRADAERYRFLAERCRSTSEHWGGRWSVVIDGPAPASHNSKDDFDAAIDKAMEATNGS